MERDLCGMTRGRVGKSELFYKTDFHTSGGEKKKGTIAFSSSESLRTFPRRTYSWQCPNNLKVVTLLLMMVSIPLSTLSVGIEEGIPALKVDGGWGRY